MRLKPWFLFAAVAVLVTAVLFGIDWYRHRYVRQNRDLVRLLPPGDLTLIYADISLLRQAELLGLLANIKVAPDQEYADFVQQTGLDYTRDLDGIVIAFDSDQTWLLGHGRFRWDRLKNFASTHQGSCGEDSCRVPASKPGRWVNFVVIQPDVLAVAISTNQAAADNLRPPGRRLQEQIPDAPVWAEISHAVLSSPASLPLPMQIFAISVQSAKTVALSARRDSILLKARFPTGAAAETARSQLEIQTRSLASALARNSGSTDRASFIGLLTGGSFKVVGTDLLGSWPIYPELVKALQ